MAMIPEDVHARVLDFAMRLVDASDAADRRAGWRLHDELRDYCEAVARGGNDHPFLWETLTDFTGDDRVAITLYARALALAEAMDAREYEASILFAMALRHASEGAHEDAHAHAVRADGIARHLDDLDLRREIGRFILEASGRP